MRSCTYLLSICAATSLLCAQSADDFELLLQDMSDIATKKSLNIDYLPSVVTLINARDFQNAGIMTLGEALEMLPGIQSHISSLGFPMTTVRGLKNPNAYLSDKIKIMIDGVEIRNESSGSSYFYMDFPLQLIDKIEVLRGPGSTMYGAGSFYGTVNVITKAGNAIEEQRIALGGGSFEERSIGFNTFSTLGEWKIFADGYWHQNDKSIYLERRKGYSDEAMHDASIGLRAVNGAWLFTSRLKKSRYHNFYELEGTLDPLPDHPGYHDNSYLFAQLDHSAVFGAHTLHTKASYSLYDSTLDTDIKDVKFVTKRFATVDVPTTEGFYAINVLQEQNIALESTMSFPVLYGNELLAGLGVRHTMITHDRYENSIESLITQNKEAILAHSAYDDFQFNATNEPAFWNRPTETMLDDKPSRTNLYMYLQDLISLHGQVDLVLGLRADHYDDFGLQLNQRAGLVYRYDERTVFKLLYGSAFRSPSLTEAYQNGHIYTRAGNDDLDPERTDTFEAVAILTPKPGHRFMLNLYHSILRDIIDLEEFPDTPEGYRNSQDRIAQGIEFEYNYRPASMHQLYFNATYSKAQYTVPPEIVDGVPEIERNVDMPDVSSVMFKAMYLFKPYDALTLGTTWRYYGATQKSPLQWTIDSHLDTGVDAYHLFNQTITFHTTPYSRVQMSINNLFDAKVRHPSYYYRNPGGVEREGTHLYLAFEQRF
ncbi:MAG: TonB-dependent receptor [Campylobacterales bacterium]|nr:TonB-dependent receptor [Campylobacterales bacterium]